MKSGGARADREGVMLIARVRPSVLAEPDVLAVDGVRSSCGSALDRSSHLPRTMSRLLVARCVGAHLLVALGVPLPPVGEARTPLLERVPVRERVPVPLRDAVRSSSRVWYAKGPTALVPVLELEDETESERSMLRCLDRGSGREIELSRERQPAMKAVEYEGRNGGGSRPPLWQISSRRERSVDGARRGTLASFGSESRLHRRRRRILADP